MDTLQQFDSCHDRTKIPAWIPPPCKNGTNMNLQQPNLKLVNITAIESHHKNLDDLSRLKRTWLGHIYLRFIKNFSSMRKICIWLWVNFYPIYLRFVVFLSRSKEKRWYPIIKLIDYMDGKNVPKLEVLNASKVDTPMPKLVPAIDQHYFMSPHNHYEFPSIYVAELSNAKVYGKSNLVFMEDTVICHDLYDFARDYTSEELHGRHLVSPKKNCLRLVRIDTTPEHIPVAAVFLDACSNNYAHWLTEILPRIAVFCSVEQYKSVPVIVDDALHPNIMESLALVIGNDREIITLPVGRAINVGMLYITSVTGYVPFERRNTKLAGHSHGLFSSSAFDLLRKELLSYNNALSPKDLPKKIYLRRKSRARNVTNSHEIEQLLIDNDYTIVESERLTFWQQFALFSNADEIVGPSGAALANLIFARPDARVVILMSKHKNMIYRYWLHMLAPLRVQVSYVLGIIVGSHVNGIHEDYIVETQHLSELLHEDGAL